MAQTVSAADVLNRLADVPGFTRPVNLTDPRLQGYIEEANGIVLQKAGYDDPPADNSNARAVVDGLVIRLAINAILTDLYGTDPAMKDVLRRERNDLLKEATELAEDDQGSEGDVFFFQV